MSELERSDRSDAEDGGEAVGRHGRTVAVIVFVAVLAQIAIPAIVMWSLPKWEDRGAFGSMFGVVGALFSGLALAGVVYAILLQRQELRLQRLELTLTRQELARTAAAQEDAASLLRQQLALAESVNADDGRRRRLESAAQLGSPNVKFSRTPGSPQTEMTLALVNHGHAIRDLEILDCSFGLNPSVSPAHLVQANGTVTLKATYADTPHRAEFLLAYLDQHATRRRISLTYWPTNNKLDLLAD